MFATDTDIAAPPPGCNAIRPAAALNLLESAELGLFLVQDWKIRYVNPATARMVGHGVSALMGAGHDVFTAPEHRPHVLAVMDRRLAGKEGRWGDMKCLHADGSIFDVRVFARRVEHEGRAAVLVSMLDVSELRAALRRAEWNAQMLARTEALARTGSMEVEWPGGGIRLSSGLRALLGLDEAAAVPATLDTIQWIPADERDYVVGIWRAAVAGEPFEFQHRVCCADGRRLTVLHRGVLVADGERAQIGVALLQDITAQRQAEERIHELASQDEVTGLPNRASLLDQMDAAMHAARWDNRAVALLAIEVPQIAAVKTSMGFGAGDTLAMAVAARLRDACHEHESIAQVSDAEFAMVFEGDALGDDAKLRARAEAVLGALAAPVRLGATELFPHCLAGAAVFPRDADAAATLLEAAQAARLDASAAQQIAFFRPEVNQRAMRSMHIEAALRRAIGGDEFELHYQPQVDLASGEIRGAEALLRWHSPELGPLSPAEFIPVAERSGLVGTIGEWVLRTACRDIARWRANSLPPVRVGINLSPAELQRPDLAAHVQRVLVESGVEPGSLSLELTEGMVMADAERAAQVLRDLKALGVEIALDDFGTGFSSLSYLCRLPIDVVKVDRSFVHDVTAPVEEVSVTRAIINMAHGLKMRVLAEGVETEGQLGLLASNGCDLVQGYWFSRPVPVAEFEAMLAARKTVPERFLTKSRKTRTLLLVDDEDNIVSALRRLLRRDGYRIVTACSGEEGLLRLAEHDVDVIVSDQRMPGMTGVEFLNRAKALYPDTVRMVLSGYTELQSIIDAVNEGAIYKFLTKPWDDERLRGHVAEAFRQKDLADENRRLARQVETANTDLADLNARLELLLSQQREHADMLAASAGSMRRLVDELPAAVAAIDPEGQIVFVNREAVERLPGALSWIGRNVREAWPARLATTVLDDQATEGDVEFEGRRFVVAKRRLPVGESAQSLLLLFNPQH
ncbi:MAG: EAL domain-containing protein [Burkholderiales bacterium]|nr:EAL domain-containing protein [Burkholderiales bacterium]